ncbi:non-canonical purine NTP pyrophosphatase [Corynebacterium sp. CCM 8863]|uniref:dITP/XTP pyrophosphatase n=1 Tax=Corynebacterium meridianum TaxID=2765363 RepID=A0A934I3X8_9CORY|nr:non-canonical purine NTP pyrophosphatase [Corynebacterium meridianum]
MLLHVASHNPKKLKELRRVLDAAGIEGIELLSSEDLLGYPEPVEDGRTFADNALIKARAGVAATGITTLADDSGLTVEELGGMPGVLSARWCGRHGDDEANNELLLAQMADVPLKRRKAAFVSVCALVTPDGEEWVEKGTWAGRLVRTPVGENGFGYDPLFIPAEEDERVADSDERPRSSAELSPEEKDALSHRGKALAALVPALAELARRSELEGTAVGTDEGRLIAVDTGDEAEAETVEEDGAEESRDS